MTQPQILSTQKCEDDIENLKIQFTAASEQKAEVEHKLEPLREDDDKLKHELDAFQTRKSQHAVNTSCSLFYHRALTA